MAPKKKSLLYEYYLGQELIFQLGHVTHPKAACPLQMHEHKDSFEFVYLKKGAQTYLVENQEFFVHHDEVFFTWPNEHHSTGDYPEEISVLYFFIIDFRKLPKLNLFSSSEEYAYLNTFFDRDRARIYKVSPSLFNAFKQLQEAFALKGLHFDTHIRNALSELLIALATPLSSAKSTPAFDAQGNLQYIQKHLEENICVADLASQQHMSVSTYNKYFVQATGIPPAEYVLRQKIEKAKELLATTTLPITEISYKYGFSSSQYFSTVFKRFSTMSPSQFRKIHQNQTSTG